MKKIIIIGIICLFVGLCFQPALAIEPKLSSDNIEDVEDCDCQEVDRINPLTAELLLSKLKVSSNNLLSRFEHIPEVEENFQELMDVINSYEQSDGRPICDFLYELLINFAYWSNYYLGKADECRENGQSILMGIYLYLGLFYYGLQIPIAGVFFLLDCYEFPR
jgi:hypothetical protein